MIYNWSDVVSALDGLARFLMDEGQLNWAQHFERLSATAASASSPSDRRAVVQAVLVLYGGMGSFNDLVLHKEGVPVVQENDQLAERRERLFEMVHGLRL